VPRAHLPTEVWRTQGGKSSPYVTRLWEWLASMPNWAARGPHSLLYRPASSAWAKTWPFIAWRSESAVTPAGRSSAAPSA